MKKNIIKTLVLSFVLVFFALNLTAQEETNTQYTILLTGASFASPENGWFEIGCKKLNAKAINRAIGGETIANTANRMFKGDLYSKEEFENMDALVIMQVRDEEVFVSPDLKDDYKEYNLPFPNDTYAKAFDYVIKRYISDCYELRNDSASKYYNTSGGKPAVIVLCTNWHDGRPTYNKSIRKLAEKWGLPLIKFDKYIGFSKNQLHPITKKQVSLIYAKDEQKMDEGEVFGWHPIRGENSYIQQRMAAIFVDEMKKILPLE